MVDLKLRTASLTNQREILTWDSYNRRSYSNGRNEWDCCTRCPFYLFLASFVPPATSLLNTSSFFSLCLLHVSLASHLFLPTLPSLFVSPSFHLWQIQTGGRKVRAQQCMWAMEVSSLTAVECEYWFSWCIFTWYFFFMNNDIRVTGSQGQRGIMNFVRAVMRDGIYSKAHLLDGV